MNENGNKYEGNWENGKLMKGKAIYLDGSYYIGEFKSIFLKHGKGTFYNQDGK